jgi:hypothetical protein
MKRAESNAGLGVGALPADLKESTRPQLMELGALLKLI